MFLGKDNFGYIACVNLTIYFLSDDAIYCNNIPRPGPKYESTHFEIRKLFADPPFPIDPLYFIPRSQQSTLL